MEKINIVAKKELKRLQKVEIKTVYLPGQLFRPYLLYVLFPENI